MKTMKLILAGLFSVALLNPIASRADDIDIYTGLSGSAGLPNVLILLDNAADFSASAGSGCTYADGTGAAAMGNTVGAYEQCALYNTIQNLPTNADGTATIKLGFMVYSTTNVASNNPSSGCLSSNNGGCLLVPLTAMTATGKTTLLSWIKSWGGTTNIKGSNQGNGLAMEEAWAYYAGKTGPSGRSYSSMQPTSGCQKNFLIYLGNAYGNSSSPSDNQTPKEDLAAAPPIANVTTTPNPDTSTIKIPSGTYGLPGVFSCKFGNPYSMGTHNDPSGLYADEWARYMYQTDIYGDATGTQDIITYTIGALGSNCKADYPALLQSIALYGGGKYFPTDATNTSSIAQAILKILNEVQAVNSVFASSSLPVSVNAQGTYLNQIYMGMFRPDAAGLPRWVGNLKQYQFCYNTTTQTLYLCDSLGQDAISSAGTGFVSPNAVSFWTSQNTSVEPDLNGGFWRNKPQGAGGGYDLPDGELVEKGGSAQVSRLNYLLEDYVNNPATPRNVYTYCPSGSSCKTNLTDSSNAFATNNGGITAAQFGTTSYVNIFGITHSVIGGVSTATVTTVGNHGFSTNDSITITGANPSAYNGTYTITVTGANTFTYPVVEYPPAPATGNYQSILHNNAAIPVTSLSRSSSTTSTSDTETVTVDTTPTPHGFGTGQLVDVAGASPGNYNGTYAVTVTGSTTFTYPITITPPATATGSYAVALSNVSAITISGLSCAKVAGKQNATFTTATTHGFVVNDLVTIAGMASAYNGTYNIKSVGSTTSFTVVIAGSSCPATTAGTATLAATQETITSLTRTGTAYTASAPYPNTATATIGTSNMYATGDVVNIVTLTAGTNETGYTSSGPYTITCASTACTTFTYPIDASPAMPVSGTITAAAHTASAQNISSLTRSYPGGTMVTATLVSGSPGYNTGNLVDISKQPGTTLPANEGAYAAQTWTVTCVGSAPCLQFTYGPIALTPGNSTVGGTAAKNSAPNIVPLIQWVRGDDNYGDEPSPDKTYTKINIRPSLHGDVLHSRPTVINYGGTIGVIVFYGANDGVYRAINGNQTAAIGTVPAGGELWSFIPTESFGHLQRMHDNSPLLLLSNTPPGIVPTPQKKDYFVDGASSVYQKLNADGTTNTAYLYLAMRRGGQFLYALDVTTPTNPGFMWKIDNSSSGFSELGQTWSQPKVAFVKGYCGGSTCSSANPPTPVLIFGAGYDATAEDSEPPTADSMGRGIFIVDATTGTLVWSATSGSTSACSGTTAKAACTVVGMNYSIPADITLMDIDSDGYIDRLYAADVGGNIWRVDLEPTAGITPNNWQVTQLAALGCNTGPCASGTTPRKFFYPADMVPTPQYDAVLIGSGDREHPLYTQQSYNVTNRFYMVKDPNPGNNGTNTVYNEANLEDITSTLAYDGLQNGYYVTLGAGEKVVNATLTVAGYTYFGTNTPAIPSSNSCTTNLGTAKGYQITPLTGISNHVVYNGGGLPPSPVAGAVSVNVNGTPEVIPFCIGCGGDKTCTGSDCKTAIGGGKPPISVSTTRTRTYWYKESD